jgi:hypothetical protein
MEGGKQQQADAREWEKAFKAGIGDYEAAPAELGGAARPPLSAAARSFALQQGSALQQAGLPSNAALGLVMRVAPGILSEEAATAQAEADLEPWFGKADPKAVAARAAQLRSDSEAAAQQQIEAMLAQLTGGR